MEYVSDIGLMVGDSSGNFNPNQAVTRAEMAALVCRMLGETEDLQTSDKFTDVPESHWANGYIARAAELGIVNGYGDGRFGPSDTVTYEQALAMVINALGGQIEADIVGGYPDGYIIVAEDFGIVEGLTAIKDDTMTRAEIAIILENSLNI